MQSKEFDSLMKGQPAKWADAALLKDIMDFDKQRPTIPTSALQQEIQKYEVPIPQPTFDEIQEYIAKLRQDGLTESKVQRIVRNKFNITVI